MIEVKKFTNCKFLHVIGMNELKCSVPLVELINDNPEHFNANEHAFVTAHRDVYRKLGHYDNVFLFEENFESKMGTCFSIPIINKCGFNADWILVHDQWFLKTLIKINPLLWKKIIWRTWGGSLFNYRPVKSVSDVFINIMRRVLSIWCKKIIKSFFAIGIANLVDEIELEENLGDVKTYPMPYCSKNACDIIRKEFENGVERTNSFNILIGHSGFSQEYHIENIERLKSFLNEDIKVYFSFSYGYGEYMKNVKSRAIDILGEKAVFLEEFMPFEEYVAFLNKMDVVILDSVHSTALGNLAIVMALKKKIYINRNGLYAKVMQREGIHCYYSDEISNVTFDEFINENIAASQYEKSNLLYKDYKMYIEDWKEFLNDLK